MLFIITRCPPLRVKLSGMKGRGAARRDAACRDATGSGLICGKSPPPSVPVVQRRLPKTRARRFALS